MPSSDSIVFHSLVTGVFVPHLANEVLQIRVSISSIANSRNFEESSLVMIIGIVLSIALTSVFLTNE